VDEDRSQRLTEVRSWARFLRSRSIIIPVNSRQQEIPFSEFDVSFLPFGLGRSLGDSCLNDGNALLVTRGLNRIMAFDAGRGRLIAEAGVTLDAVLRFIIPQGWFLSVTPGTRFVTLGGAIANDVHGKNHHIAGTFGRHVVRFELRRSDGTRLVCSPEEHGEWFRATIGGLGLTGLIEWVEVQLKPIQNSFIDSETIRYDSVDEFYALSEESLSSHEFAVAWVDTLSRRGLGRGLFIRGNHNGDPERKKRTAPTGPHFSIPVVLPFSVINRGTLTCFSNVFYMARAKRKMALAPFRQFFYPLDSIGAYHRLYGPGGMIQWQGLIPSREAAREVLTAAAAILLAAAILAGYAPARRASRIDPMVALRHE